MQAFLRGANHPDIGALQIRCLRAQDAGPQDLLWADGLALGTPENFGYMSGALKDFFDRTFYEVEGRMRPLPYVLFISAGNDGTGAQRAIARIANGYPLVEVQAPLISRGEITQSALTACEELGSLMAAGLDAGIY